MRPTAVPARAEKSGFVALDLENRPEAGTTGRGDPIEDALASSREGWNFDPGKLGMKSVKL